MEIKHLFSLLSFYLISSNLMSQKIDYVNTFIGTNGMGHTFPGACSPYGIVQVSPDTDTIPYSVNGIYQPKVYEYCAGYQHKDKTIVGFSHTHFSGTGHSDLGDILLMPYTGETKYNPGTSNNPDTGYRSRFNHNTEKSRPGFYEVKLDDDNINVELTATSHVGIHRYTYPKNKNKRIILDLIHGIYNYDGKVLWANIRVENDTLITGYRITNGWSRVDYTYFAMKFSEPIKNYGYKEKAHIEYYGGFKKFDCNNNFPEIGGRKIVAHFDFGQTGNNDLTIKVALSGVSTEGAIKNLENETHGKSFEELLKETTSKWNNSLSIIYAKGNNDQLSMLYTSLYHTMINPSIYMDVDHNYRGIDHNIHKAKDFNNYTIFSLWDTFRALHPLYNIINRKLSCDLVKSMLAHYKQSVHHILPIWSHMGNENWCMIGYHAVSVLADAINTGIPIDKEEALKAMISSSNVPYYGNTKEYIKYGYVPMEYSPYSVSITLENSYEDWAIYEIAKKMNIKDVAELYKKRAESFQNVYNPKLEFAAPKDKDGKWKDKIDLLSTNGQGFIEGNSWNYSFYVPQDVDKLIEIMGGDKGFIRKLDSLFTMHLPDKYFEETEDVTREGILGSYVHGNEPSHHIAYLYSWTSQPWKTQYWIREIMNKMYRNNIDGLCGNDDCGQMSAWYIFSAMGFYPVCPGSNQYVFGTPYLPYMKINLENGKKFEIIADNVSDANRYIKYVLLNGEKYNKSYITNKDILNGGKLQFIMTSKPNKKRVFPKNTKPYSLSNDFYN